MNEIRKIAIVEDDKPAARLLESMLKALRPQWEVYLLPGSIAGAAEWFTTHDHPDILFLDIHLSDGNSFQLLELVRPQSLIVFTTAFDEYAVQAFTVNSIDYLLKPFEQERLLDAIVKYETITGAHAASVKKDELLDVLRSLSNPGKKFRTRFLISKTDKSYKLDVNDVAYFYSEGKITFAVTFQGKEHIIDLTLDRLTEQLDPDLFFRANRQTLLHEKAITRIESYFHGKIVVHTQPAFREKILVSREKAKSFKWWLNY